MYSYITSLSKKFNIPEGIVSTLFKRALGSKIGADPEFKRIALDLDDAFTRLRKKAQERQKQGKPIPDSWKHFLD